MRERSAPISVRKPWIAAEFIRAFYAAYCTSREYTISHPRFAPSGVSDDHRLLRTHFQSRGMVSVASRLNDLRWWRNHCDYDNQVPNAHILLANAIAKAQQVLAELV